VRNFIEIDWIRDWKATKSSSPPKATFNKFSRLDQSRHKCLYSRLQVFEIGTCNW
jgi:hypothetical protein